MKKFVVLLAIAFPVTLVSACNNSKSPAASSPETETKGEQKQSLKDTAWDLAWDNTKYKRLEFTSDANVTLKGGEAPETGIPGTYTLAEGGAFTLTAGDITESGAFDGTILKVAGADGKKDPIYPDEFAEAPPNEASSRH